ncbi:HD domain-containing phosphohydrolase [Vibrio sp. 10N.286.49.B1]|uniref:HD domain-containing phosphohydrolase n=1 Tax=unclassified Vibrio TaxID=2614977 RepID=UPI000C84C056|nr:MULTISPECIES: HD domain-containing phosphohydrolase [unclassified Vibrio]
MAEGNKWWSWSRLRYPLHVHITSLFLAIILTVCGVQIWLTQNGLSQVLLDANEHLFDRIAKETQSNLAIHYQPALAIVEALSQGELSRHQDANERLGAMPEMISLLSSSPYVLSYSMVFPSGDFLIAFQPYNPMMRAALKVKPETKFIVFNYSNADNRLMSYEFDNTYQVVKTELRTKLHFIPQDQQWYKDAIRDELLLSDPYYFPLVDKIGTTFSKRAANGVVIAADLTLEQISSVLAESVTRKSSFRVLFDGSYRLYAYSNPTLIDVEEDLRKSGYLHLDDIANPVVKEAVSKIGLVVGRSVQFEALGETWIGRIERSPSHSGHNLYLLMVVKSNELLGKSQAIAKTSIYASLIVLCVALPFVYAIAQRISNPIKIATERARRIERFDFNLGDVKGSYIKEIHELSQSLYAMQQTIASFLALTKNIAKVQDLERLLELLSSEALQSTGATVSYLYLCDASTNLKPHCVLTKSGDVLDVDSLKAIDINDSELEAFRYRVLTNKQPFVYEYHAAQALIDGMSKDESFLFIPLFDRREHLLGGFGLLVDSATIDDLLKRKGPYIDALAEYASVAIETKQILEDQKALMQSFIEVMAGAVDTKSPYTGNHCQRVPVLTEMLTQAAVNSQSEAFNDFTLSEDQWQELHLAAWLHDCGKVTTPEHVVDKATKLETIYNRIHEVRTRFEVLKRDAHIATMSNALGRPLEGQYKQSLEKEWRQLDDDFSFIAQINLGGEFLDDDAIARLHVVAQKQWKKTIDERLGLSWEERSRYGDEAFEPGASESVLVDASAHNVPWKRQLASDKRFNLKKPDYQNRLGEVYNLSIKRGTLNDEERYIINNHIVETIKMLESLPFPKSMSNVPSIAGGHHEKIDGTGYPLGLKGEDMPVTARIMALADVFEALTSADRPYKTPKTLSESLRIMSFMVKDNHLDQSLFTLFLESGVYLVFAEKFLKASQIDDVNIADYL